MVPAENFIPVITSAVPRFRRNPPNDAQVACILHDRSVPLMIVAGPGSGKTTVLVLRALRLVFVDGILPKNIILTTFTRKAATEIRSRLIEWGQDILGYLSSNPAAGAAPDFVRRLEAIDVNTFVTGTLDAICEEVLTTQRNPADPAPTMVEKFVGSALLMFEGLFPSGARTNAELTNYLSKFGFDGAAPKNFAETLRGSRTILDRLIHDRVNLDSFRTSTPYGTAKQCLVDSLLAYRRFMEEGNRLDFARLEELFYERLSAGRLERMTSGVRALLVDEYQDTNPLQEAIYFELLNRTQASVTVVGDDDQSLYRFRGATVELFRDFAARHQHRFPLAPRVALRYLVDNYRSTPEIVSHFNTFVQNDPSFVPARVQPVKPAIVARLPPNGIPVLGMFRPDAATLSTDLSDFLMNVFRGNGHPLPDGIPAVRRNVDGGDFGDCVFLASSVDELRFDQGGNKERLPRMLRDSLAQRGVSVFNPRGRALRDIDAVSVLLGLVLECIDAPTPTAPDGGLQTTLARGENGGPPSLRNEASVYFSRWRQSARAFVATNPQPNQPHTLSQFVLAWQSRTPQVPGIQWPREWPLLELCFKLISWIPTLRDDPEGQVYLEAIARCISHSATFSSYRAALVQDRNQPRHRTESVKRAILDVLAPLAEGQIDVDEDIMPSVPRSWLSFMTIHQAKGLEYPLVVVDVGSDFKINHPKQRFKRFPSRPSGVQELEDDLAPHCEIGGLRMARTGLQRSFDDLVRLYYVAYSRPQSVLLLVGLNKSLQVAKPIPNVALGWRADQSWAWQPPFTGRAPAMATNIPLRLI